MMVCPSICLPIKPLWRTLLVFAIALVILCCAWSTGTTPLERAGAVWSKAPDKALPPAIERPTPSPTVAPLPLTTTEPRFQPSGTATTTPKDWADFAYCLYVTTDNYLCNALMVFESLVQLHTKPDRLMMYPHTWDALDENSTIRRLLRKAKDDFGVRLSPISVQRLPGDSTWSASFTKLLAFNQTQYKRVLSLDSDGTVMQSLDELFLSPSAPVAMPRAYWLNDHSLSSQLMLIEPSVSEFGRIQHMFDVRSDKNEFDMEIVNKLYAESCAVLPHRSYDLLTGEFRSDDHTGYLGSATAPWDPDAVLRAAKYVHFSDWPLPKPWFEVNAQQREELMPPCRSREGVEGLDCAERDIWMHLYEDFRRRRKHVCGLDLL